MRSVLFHNQFRVPSYQDWIDDGADWADVYEFHQRQLQHLQWRCPGERWVLKTGAHMWSLEYLLRQYPDAQIVFTHRDPVKSVTSYASLTTLVRTMGSEEVDRFEIAGDWTPRLAKAINHAIEVRDSMDCPEAKIYEMYFDDFVEDQFAEVERIYEAFDIEMPGNAADRIRAFIEENPKGKHGEHEYTEEEYGIDPQQVREQFARYIDRFGVEPE